MSPTSAEPTAEAATPDEVAGADEKPSLPDSTEYRSGDYASDESGPIVDCHRRLQTPGENVTVDDFRKALLEELRAAGAPAEVKDQARFACDQLERDDIGGFMHVATAAMALFEDSARGCTCGNCGEHVPADAERTIRAFEKHAAWRIDFMLERLEANRERLAELVDLADPDVSERDEIHLLTESVAWAEQHIPELHQMAQRHAAELRDLVASGIPMRSFAVQAAAALVIFAALALGVVSGGGERPSLFDSGECDNASADDFFRPACASPDEPMMLRRAIEDQEWDDLNEFRQIHDERVEVDQMVLKWVALHGGFEPPTAEVLKRLHDRDRDLSYDIDDLSEAWAIGDLEPGECYASASWTAFAAWKDECAGRSVEDWPAPPSVLYDEVYARALEQRSAELWPALRGGGWPTPAVVAEAERAMDARPIAPRSWNIAGTLESLRKDGASAELLAEVEAQYRIAEADISPYSYRSALAHLWETEIGETHNLDPSWTLGWRYLHHIAVIAKWKLIRERGGAVSEHAAARRLVEAGKELVRQRAAVKGLTRLRASLEGAHEAEIAPIDEVLHAAQTRVAWLEDEVRWLNKVTLGYAIRRARGTQERAVADVAHAGPTLVLAAAREGGPAPIRRRGSRRVAVASSGGGDPPGQSEGDPSRRRGSRHPDVVAGGRVA